MRRRRSEPPLVAAARRAGVQDTRILTALEAVPRERFVPRDRRRDVDRDRPIRIAEGQTTSQPSLIAAMLQALELTSDDHVLEIGTGTGYQAALLSQLVAQVYTVERFPRLAEAARRNLAACGIDNVEVVVGDGTKGLPEYAPYDAITIAAATPELPAVLGEQLVDGGRLIAPVGPEGVQEVLIFRAEGGRLEQVRRLTGVRFVPLVPGDPSSADGPR